MSRATLFLCLVLGVFFPCGDARSACGDGPASIDNFDYLGSGIDKKDVYLSEYSGKQVVVIFWESWCGYCRRALPELDKLQRKTGKDALAVIAVNYGEKPREIRKFLRKWRGRSVTVTRNYKRDEKGELKVTGFPAIYLFDRQGELQYKSCGYGKTGLTKLVEWMSYLDKKEPDKSSKSMIAPPWTY